MKSTSGRGIFLMAVTRPWATAPPRRRASNPGLGAGVEVAGSIDRMISGEPCWQVGPDRHVPVRDHHSSPEGCPDYINIPLRVCSPMKYDGSRRPAAPRGCHAYRADLITQTARFFLIMNGAWK